MCKVCIEEYKTIIFSRTQVLYLPGLVSNLLTYLCLDLIYVTLAVADVGVKDNIDRLTTAFHNLAAVCILIKSRFVLFLAWFCSFSGKSSQLLGPLVLWQCFLHQIAKLFLTMQVLSINQVGNTYHLSEETNFVVEKDTFVQSFIRI